MAREPFPIYSLNKTGPLMLQGRLIKLGYVDFSNVLKSSNGQ